MSISENPANEKKEEIDWIVTPGLKQDIDKFIELLKILLIPAKSPIQNKRHLIIHAPTGTGKSLFIEIFKKKYLKDNEIPEAKCVRFNCASVAQSFMLSELFGYTPGSFTGALKEGKKGLIEKANGGLLILEEIGEILKPDQAKLLTFIEDGKYYQVGGRIELLANVQIIATTHRSIEDFREDFWYRFHKFNLSPLHKRRGDILYYIYHLNTEILKYFSCNRVFQFMAYNWRGGVRELKEKIIDFQLYVNLFKNNIIGIYDFEKEFPEQFFLKDFDFSKYHIDYNDIEKFMKKIGYNIDKYKPAFSNKNNDNEKKLDSNKNEYFEYQNISDLEKLFTNNSIPDIDIIEKKYGDSNLPTLEICNIFQNYETAFREFCAMFWDSIENSKSILELKEGSGLITEEKYLVTFTGKYPNQDFRPFHISNINECLMTKLKKWTKKDIDMHRKLFTFRHGLKEENIKIDLDSLTESEILQYLYERRLKLYSTKKDAAKSLGFKPSTFQSRLKKLGL